MFFIANLVNNNSEPKIACRFFGQFVQIIVSAFRRVKASFTTSAAAVDPSLAEENHRKLYAIFLRAIEHHRILREEQRQHLIEYHRQQLESALQKTAASVVREETEHDFPSTAGTPFDWELG